MQRAGSERSGRGCRRLGVTGHQQLPPTAADMLERRLDEMILLAPEITVVCSLAVGADSEVAGRVLRAGGGLHAVLPCDHYEETFADSEALATYRFLLSQAKTVERLDFAQPSEEAFLAAGYRVVDQCECLLAVWDGQPARGLGGTADVVSHAHQLGKEVEVLWPAGVRR